MRQASSLACLFLFAASLTVPEASAQSRRYRPPPSYVQLKAPDQAEGKAIIEEFRQRGIAGQFFFEFQLHVLPRRGTQRSVPGILWGGRNERGPIWRVVVQPGVRSVEKRLLVQNGPESAVWSWAPGQARVEALGSAALFNPLADTDLTPFDLQMPFLYWSDFVFEGVARVRGRPAHSFLLYPPDVIAAQKPELTGVRVYLDTQFNVLVQAEQIGVDNKILKSMTVLDVKKVDEQWVPKTIDFRDETTRNKTQFSLVGAALGLDFAGAVFEPATLSDSIRPPAADRIRRVGP